MWQACPLKYRLRIKEGWTTRRKSAALGFGGCIHEGLATWYRTKDKVKALMAINSAWPVNMPVDDYRTKEKCLSVMQDYIKKYPEENFKIVGFPESPMVECTFTIATGMYLPCPDCKNTGIIGMYDTHCSSCGKEREEIEYGGIFDGLVETMGVMYVLEHKSTSQMGNYYFNQFKPNNQVTGYIWAAGKLVGLAEDGSDSRRIGGAIINAMGVYKASVTKYERELTTRSKDDIKGWLLNLYETCCLIKQCERTNTWPMFTQSCTMYGQCEFHSVHVLGSEKEREKFLEQQFAHEEWVYENRAGVKDE